MSYKLEQGVLFSDSIISERKDWRGNMHSVLVTNGASNHSKESRAQDDFYASSPIAAEWLCKLEDFEGPIRECACGQGHLSKVFQTHGYEVKSTDLVYRGYGEGGINFLSPDITFFNGNIITNPPFSYAQEFVEKGLSIIPDGKKVAMFLRILFLEGKKRKLLFEKSPPRRIYVSSSRIVCAKNGEFDKQIGGVQAYAWFIWEKGFRGDPVIKWFN